MRAEPLLPMHCSVIDQCTQGTLNIDADMPFQRGHLGRQPQSRAFVLGQDRLGSRVEDPLQLILIALTNVQRTAGLDQCLQRSIQRLIAARQDQPRAVVVRGARGKVAHQPQQAVLPRLAVLVGRLQGAR
ncbi:hypothetical protein D3C76_665530 [compost metagenome]